ncbi:hypothetical protein OOZ15_08895 [Galbibacter sp. EGI 63066]|uniref:hypothetical protein n=1 Tax=Galbibacter sp. EGI 63066 TaxID=2993559 RepID=UPI00224924E3|nr:hypothetical protein [Galbibacter sp. EGI 63066]MCX2680052.1 hypothetical protein [Galbibacter sp. EGI 63066]
MKDKNTKTLEKYIFDEVTKEIEEIIKTEKGAIYTYSFYIYDAFADPLNASLTLGYNTIEQLGDNVHDPHVKWGEYTDWVNDNVIEIGTYDDSKGHELIENWVKEIGLYYTEEEYAQDSDACMDKAREVTQHFIQMLVRVIQKIHRQYKLEVPIIIHQLEAYEGETEYNIQANGKALAKEFTDAIGEYSHDLYGYILYALLKLKYMPEDEKEDIYAYSLFVDDNDPRWPKATLGYNTLSHFDSVKENAKTEQEAKWNFDFWLQNNIKELCSENEPEGREIIGNYTAYKELYYTDEEFEKDKAKCLEKGKEITQFFIDKLVSIIPFIQRSCKTDKPIIIHKSGYDKQIAALNEKANGEEKVKEFVAWIETL